MLVKSFFQISKADAAIAGGKGASLGEMTQAGIPVPPGFVVLANAFERFLEETDLNVEIDTILHSVDHKEMHTVENASEKIQALILGAKMPKDIAVTVKKFYKELDAQYVAVRSSATAEDSASAAWAGQLDSFLNTTEKALLTNVQKCWASLFTPRAIFYRFEKGLHTQKISVAVVVQKMVESECSGIAFSVHPVTEDRNQLIIEAGFGLGEAIVSGSITPDSYVVEKEPRRIIDTNISTQTRALYRVDSGGNEWKDVSEPKASAQVLTGKQTLELSELILRIENHYGFPCDIEWAFEDEKFYITQSRPITTLKSGDIPSSKAYSIKNKNEYIGLGRWVVPVLESEEWMDWCNTDEAGALGITSDNPAALAIDGHFYLPKDGAYTKLKKRISKEFESEDFEFTTKILDLGRDISNECTQMVDGLNSDPSFEDFIRAFNLMAKLRFPWMACFPIGDAGEEFIKKYAAEHSLSENGVVEMIPQLPNSLIDDQKELSMLREQIENENLSFDIASIEVKNRALAEVIREYQKKTEYIGTHHFWGDERNVNRLMDAIKNASIKSEDPKQQKNRFKGFEIIAEATKWRLECAQSSALLAYAFRPYMTALAREHQLTYDDLIYLSTQEIADLGKGLVDPILRIRERQKAVGMLKVDGSIHIVIGKELRELQKHFGLLDVYEAVTELRGSIGNKGVVQGVVGIVLKPSDQLKVHPGMILVAPETTPDYIPAMGKAAAFVTDQGGITSHAAIVAREMRKPCIIGTKIATKTLKDGDIVEVDADNGIVRVLNKN